MKQLHASHSFETISITVESSVIWELIVGIAGYTHDRIRHTFDLDERWTEEENSMPQSLRDNLKFMKETNFWYGLIMLQNKLSSSSVQEFSNQLYALSSEEFYEILLPYGSRKTEAYRKELARNYNQKAQFKEYAKQFHSHEYLSSYVLTIALYEQQDLCKIIHDTLDNWSNWVTCYKEWDKWTQAIFYEQKQHRNIDLMNPVEEIQRITDGVRYLPEPSIWHIKLIPQLSYRPWTLEIRSSDTKLFFYPLNDDYLLEPGKPSQKLVRGHKALGDELRLKLLYQLQQGPLSLQEMSTRFSISKTTLHHQLSILKSAKFVKVHKGIYSVNKSGIDSFSEQLQQFLGGK